MPYNKQNINHLPSKSYTSLTYMIFSSFDLKIMQASYVMTFVDLFQLKLPQYYNWNM